MISPWTDCLGRANRLTVQGLAVQSLQCIVLVETAELGRHCNVADQEDLAGWDLVDLQHMESPCCTVVPDSWTEW